jgi:hypothetical protein
VAEGAWIGSPRARAGAVIVGVATAAISGFLPLAAFAGPGLQ